MKRILPIIILILGFSIQPKAQRIINEDIAVSGQGVEMAFDFADDIKIEAWNKNSIELQVSVNLDDNQYNDFYSLEINKINGTIKLIEKVDFDGIKKEKGEKELRNFHSQISYSLKIPENLEFNLNTISGEIELVACQGEMAINTVSGFIDYSIPKSHDARIDLSTVTGDVYSNLNFEMEMNDEISWVGTNQELKFNKGNVDVELKTISGDIYLREK